MGRPSGLTLIELLTTVALVSILSMLSVPTFADLLRDLRMTSRINAFVHAVHLAKQASQQLFAEVAICKSADAIQCDINTSWAEGWIAFVNLNQDHPPRVDPGERILAVGDAFDSGAITANRQHFIFRPFAIRSTNGTLVFCDTRGADQSRAVVISYTGRPRVESRSRSTPNAPDQASDPPSTGCRA
jgi:type IV fimbrial biogenesis protein FimT